jgi:hypothetical protein
MAAEKESRGFELYGDSPELIAFAILRSVIQLGQAKGETFDKDSLLATYSECLSAVKGTYKPSTSQATPAAARAPASRKAR